MKEGGLKVTAPRAISLSVTLVQCHVHCHCFSLRTFIFTFFSIQSEVIIHTVNQGCFIGFLTMRRSQVVFKVLIKHDL